MSQNVYQTLSERGFIYQATAEEELPKLLASPQTCYVGFDPTASSLHVGSLVPIMAMAHMQRAGHRVITLVGGGTAMVGDPSGKTELRKMLSTADIDANAACLKQQLSRYVSYAGGDDFVDNATWLRSLSYVEFLRDIGRHFSVNRMLTAESVKSRLETGLSFIEFNYMLLQAYDFYVLMRDQKCTLQLGGQDQWGNIVAGTDLCRRMLGEQGYGITFPLITNASGQKFGKSVAGAIWLDAQKTVPFDFYQFWRNCDDRDLERFLLLFTFLPVAEAQRLGALTAAGINRAKEILAYEATKITHGKELADAAYRTALNEYGSADPQGLIETSSEIVAVAAGGAGAEEFALPAAELDSYKIIDLICAARFASSKSQARSLIKQRAVRVDEQAVEDPNQLCAAYTSGSTLQVGKKRRLIFTY